MIETVSPIMSIPGGTVTGVLSASAIVLGVSSAIWSHNEDKSIYSVVGWLSWAGVFLVYWILQIDGEESGMGVTGLGPILFLAGVVLAAGAVLALVGAVSDQSDDT